MISRNRFLARLLLVAALCCALAACTPALVPLDDLLSIPAPPGATLYEGSAEPLIDTLLAAGHDALGAEYRLTDSRIFLAGPASSRAQLSAFYQAELPPRGWAARADTSLTGSLGSAWQRGTQRLTVVFLTADSAELVVVLLSTRP
jgi:hypothetical protein